jgi:hypothetical protein
MTHALPFKVMSRPLPLDYALASESCLGQVLPYPVAPGLSPQIKAV